MFQVRIKTSADNILCSRVAEYDRAEEIARAIWNAYKAVGFHSMSLRHEEPELYNRMDRVINNRTEVIEILIREG